MAADSATPRPTTITTQLPIPSPAMVTVAPAASHNAMPQHAPTPTAASAPRASGDSVLPLGEDITELIERRRPGRPVRSLIDAARKPDGIVCVGERVHAVDENARRTSKPGPLRFLGGVDDAPSDRHFRMLRGEHVEVGVGGEPVGAVIEVQQGDVHAITVNLAPWFKVKG